MIDKVVEAVREDLLRRSKTGIDKYGVTLDRKDLSMKQWLQHAYEECLDQANYLKKCILEIEAEEWAKKTLDEAKVKFPDALDMLIDGGIPYHVDDPGKNGNY
jgi:hypothetical protein